MSSSDSSSITVKDAPLVVIVTKLGTTSEWVDWGFDEEDRIAFVGESSPRVSMMRDIQDNNLLERINTEDVCVINGKYFWGDTFEILGSIGWKDISRRIIKYMHIGRNRSFDDSDVKRIKKDSFSRLQSAKKRKNAKIFLEDPVPFKYSLMGESIANRAGLSPVADFALVIRHEKNDDKYNEALRALRLVGMRKKLSMLKHRLSHLFIPISVDLEGWKESGFSEEYAKEIKKEYNNRVNEILKEARRILYDIDEVPQRDTIEELVKDTKKMAYSEEEKGINSKWKKVKEMLPKEGQHSEPRKTLELMCKLDEKKGPVDNSYFQEWFANFEEALDELRDRFPAS